MTRHAGIVDYYRAEGLTVVEVNGAATRGHDDFAPRCSLNHHTGGPETGLAPSLRYIIDNVLANSVQSREQDARGLDVVYFVAAGTAAHAGKGSWKGKTRNRDAWGLEVEHPGRADVPFPAKRMETAVRIHTAHARYSGFTAEDVMQHWEWAENPPGWPGRKTDMLPSLVPPAAFRNRVAVRLSTGPVTVPSLEDPMVLILSTAKPANGRWPHYALVDRSANAATITATPGAPFKAGLETIKAPTFRYGSAYGLSVLTVSGLTSAPLGIAETPTGDVVLCCADGSTFQIAG